MLLRATHVMVLTALQVMNMYVVVVALDGDHGKRHGSFTKGQLNVNLIVCRQMHDDII